MPAAAIVFAAAPVRATPRLRQRLNGLRAAVVVAADDGATSALAFGFRPDLIVGDLDSLEPATRAQLEGIPIELHPRDKDVTDGQLAIQRALQFEPDALYLVGFLGGPRLDQELANIFLLVGLEQPAVLLDEQNECTLIRAGGGHAWSPEAGEVVSLIPLSAEVTGVRTSGLRWSLNGDRLRRGDTRGVSNEAIATEAGVSIEGGLLLLTRHFLAL